MNTLFFKYVLEVERTRSITQAAENLFMAQPNLSKAIKEAEDSLGYELFERTSKGVTPTEKGCEFLKYAKEIVQKLDDIEAIGEKRNGNIQALSVSMPRGSYISRALVNFTNELDMSKEINLNIIETGSMQTINNVAEKKFNLGIIRYQTIYEQYFQDYLNEKNLSNDIIWDFSYLALMSERHTLAAKEKIDVKELYKSIEIIHGDTVVPYYTQDKDKTETGMTTKKRIFLYERANQFELLSYVPQTFMWVSPIPQNILARYELVQRRCEIPFNDYKDVLIYPNRYVFTEYDRLFINKVYEIKNDVAYRKYI